MTSQEPIPVSTGIRKALTRRLQRKIESRTRRLIEAQQELMDRSGVVGVTLAPQPEISTPKTAKQIVAAFDVAFTVAERTVMAARHCLRKFTRWAGDKLFDRELLEAWVKHVSATTYSSHHKNALCGWVMRVARWAHATGRIDRNIATGIKIVSSPPQQAREPFTKEEVDKLIMIAGERENTKYLAFLIKLAWETGMAITDACTLKWGHIDLSKCIITRPRTKTGTLQIAPFDFGGRLHDAIIEQQKETIHVFGKIAPEYPVCLKACRAPNHSSEAFTKLVKKSGMPPRTFHSLRGTFVTDCVNKNVPLPVAMSMVGIKTTETFVAYAKLKPETIREHRAAIR